MPTAGHMLRYAVAAAIQHPETYAGQFIPVWDEQLTPTELVATFTKVTGKPAKCVLHGWPHAHVSVASAPVGQILVRS